MIEGGLDYTFECAGNVQAMVSVKSRNWNTFYILALNANIRTALINNAEN